MSQETIDKYVEMQKSVLEETIKILKEANYKTWE
jgi:hypothetical protein